MEENQASPELKRDLRHIFLREFIIAAISQVKVDQPERGPEFPVEEKIATASDLNNEPEVSPPVEFNNAPTTNKVRIEYPKKMMRQSSFRKQPTPQTTAPQENNMTPSMNSSRTSRPAPPIIMAPPGSPDLGKLNFLLKDPRVNAIECPGPGKNILVKKDGSTQSTSISLQEEEIKNIVSEFSEKTRIPVIGGLFKSAFGNMILSSISSEFVGTSFIIQKKNSLIPLV